MEPIGDPDGETGDFAEEHENTEVTTAEDGDGEGEPESPDRWTGGMDREGPPCASPRPRCGRPPPGAPRSAGSWLGRGRWCR
jgi:hypothetical protein